MIAYELLMAVQLIFMVVIVIVQDDPNDVFLIKLRTIFNQSNRAINLFIFIIFLFSMKRVEIQIKTLREENVGVNDVFKALRK